MDFTNLEKRHARALARVERLTSQVADLRLRRAGLDERITNLGFELELATAQYEGLSGIIDGGAKRPNSSFDDSIKAEEPVFAGRNF